MTEQEPVDSETSLKTVEFECPARFRVLKKIATGGMGTVYLAEQLGAEGFSKTAAIKVLRPDFLTRKTNLDLFIGEAKLVADLIHENILQVYQLEQVKGQYFIVMEYVNGKNLIQLLSRLKKNNELIDPEMGAFITSRVCRALHYAHTKRDRSGKLLGIVHRDVTPSNVIIDWGGVVKLMDFGIAKAITMSTPDERKVLMGKWPYMSPEQVRYEGTDARSDVFALGLVMYEVLTGSRIYNVKTREDLVNSMFNYRIRDVRALNANIPEELAKICMKALAFDPNDRFQTAREMGQALEYYMYHDRYGPTNEKLSDYLARLFPEVNRDVIL
ncbi:MAG: serine/threonine protein kinase [Planctomycetes bacterium]|nr:serine/threonine protein kinase [Planctomycetota bacterium]